MRQKHKILKVISFLVNPAWMYSIALMVSVIFLGSMLFAQEDSIYDKCTSQMDNPAPWCYLDEVKAIGDPTLCENILKYWPTAVGVHGQCYYELAIQTKDCELCNRIKKDDIRRMCKLDVCK